MYDLSLLKAHGEDVYISNVVEIKRPNLLSLRSHIAIDSYFYCTTHLLVLNYVHIAPMVSIIGGAGTYVRIGNFCTISAGCRLIGSSDEFHGDGLVSTMIPKKYRDTVITAPIEMQDFSSLASNVIVTPGVVIGEGAVVGAGSYVSHDIPAWQIWAGSPARFICERPKEKMIQYGKELLDG